MSEILQRQTRVKADWIDYNGHMNVAYYVLVFDHSTDALLESLGLGEAYRQGENKSFFVVESHVTYENEVKKMICWWSNQGCWGMTRSACTFFTKCFWGRRGRNVPPTKLWCCM